MDKMIALNTEIINRQDCNVENKGIILCWETYKFHAIKLSGNRNQCLQYCLNAFYHDVDDLKKSKHSLFSCALGSICSLSYK